MQATADRFTTLIDQQLFPWNDRCLPRRSFLIPGWGNCKRLQRIGKAVKFRKNQKGLSCQALRCALKAFFALAALHLCMIFSPRLVKIDSAPKIIINNQRIFANQPRGGSSYTPKAVCAFPLDNYCDFFAILAASSRSRIISFCASVNSRFVLYGFFPNLNGNKAHFSTVQSLTSLLLPQQQSIHFSRMAFSGNVAMPSTTHSEIARQNSR